MRLVAYSGANLGLTGSDTDILLGAYQGPTTPCDAVFEWAGRTCYRSNEKMGKSPTFIEKRLAEGHADIVEHGYAVVLVDAWGSGFGLTAAQMLMLKAKHKYLEIHPDGGDWENPRWVYLGGNIRTWLKIIEDDTLSALFCEELRECLSPVAPKTIKPVLETYPLPFDLVHIESRRPYQGQLAHLLTFCKGPSAALSHAVMMYEGVSRAFTHQIVRHRMLAFSQESQRYCDLGKTGGVPVVPESMMGGEVEFEGATYTTDELIRLHWDNVERVFDALRREKVRKEDARFVLPNMAQTRIIASGTMEGWEHFLWLRCDPAAQWEIRNHAWATLDMLEEVWPNRFQAIKDKFPRN